MCKKFNCFILSLGGVGHIELGIVSLGFKLQAEKKFFTTAN